MSNRLLTILACASIVWFLSLGARAQTTDPVGAQSPPSWSSPSLRSETVVGSNGAITTRTALLANDKWGIGNTKRVEKVTDFLKEGQIVKVKVLETDEKGRVKLSMKALIDRDAQPAHHE